MATQRRSCKVVQHDPDQLNAKWDQINSELDREARAARPRELDLQHPSHFQLARFAGVLKTLHAASCRMPMLAYRLREDPLRYARYDRSLLRLRLALGHISIDRVRSDRSYSKLKNAQLRRLDRAAATLSAEICRIGDQLQWIDIVYGN